MTTDQTDNANVDAHDENKLIAARREKLSAIREKRVAFPNDFTPTASSEKLIAQYDAKDKEALASEAVQVSVAGRIIRMRGPFTVIQDGAAQMQLYMNNKSLPEELVEEFKALDLGDIIGLEGELFKTGKDELTIRVASFRLLTKSLRPLPDKFKGLTDTEMRYRQRYVDLIVNEESRRIFAMRSKIVRCIRDYFEAHQFMEVETPMMQAIPGGATAAPFVTHYNALGIDMYLRVAPELNLKRLVVGGFERVFEINRNFRNEGMSTKHSPEFTMLEFYWAYADFNELMDLTENLFREVALQVLGTTRFVYKDAELDFGLPFKRMTMAEAIVEYNPTITTAQLSDLVEARQLAKSLGLELDSAWGIGRLVMEIFEATVEERVTQPVFITQHPIEVSPLARRNDQHPDMTDRFELFCMGQEIANGFSELNDAEDQAERFRQQVEAKDAGDEEAMHFDDDYVTALEYGLPPTAGEGIGIDRLVMLLTNSASIRDVVLFPHMRPKH